METVFLLLIAAPVLAVAGRLAVVRARLAALYPNPESHPDSGRSGALECFAFIRSNEHRGIRDRALTQAVMVSRWPAAASLIVFAGLFLGRFA